MSPRLVIAGWALATLACQQSTPPPPTWAEAVSSWQASSVQLSDGSKAPLATLDTRSAQGDAEAGELAQAVRSALAELEKTRLTAEQEVRSGRWKPEEAVANVGRALQKAEARVELATSRTAPADPTGKGAPEPAQPAD